MQAVANYDKPALLGYQNPLAVIALQYELLGFYTKSTVDMLAVNRDSVTPGFGFPGWETASRPESPKRRKLNSDGQSSVSRSAKQADNVSPSIFAQSLSTPA
jgi:hypothetical protein